MRNLTLTILLLLTVCSQAKEPQDTAYERQYKRYFMLYGEPQHEDEFHKVSDWLMDYYLRHDKMRSYYKIMVNGILHEAEKGRSYRAIINANEMMEDMKRRDVKYYEMAYAALGTIFETRGNYRMAMHYYMNALENAEPQDTSSLMSIYSKLASLKTTREPEKAWEWNEKFGAVSVNHPDYHKLYLALKGEINFFMNQPEQFRKTYQEFQQYFKDHPGLDKFGIPTMEVINATLNKDYDRALQILDTPSADFNPIDRCDIRIKVFETMGDKDRALEEVNRRRDLRDSLNSDMLFENINEINAEVGIMKIHEKAAKEREFWLAVVIVLLLVGLGLVVSRYLLRQRYQKKLLRQNKELEIALSRAEESDRMKTSFIEQVSHEIRTPLNIITGFAQVITNPEYMLEENERNTMLSEISRNTVEITNIVNELLEVSQEDSRQHYELTDYINVEQLCKKMMDQANKINSRQLTLKFSSLIDSGFVLHSNREVLEKILSQLLKNAIKFTNEGTVELKVRERAANGGIEFAVTDTGIGIDQQYHDKIFERFFKVDHFKQGLGLGLTMSRKMAELLGGSLQIDGSYKQGARFLLVVPTEQL